MGSQGGASSPSLRRHRLLHCRKRREGGGRDVRPQPPTERGRLGLLGECECRLVGCALPKVGCTLYAPYRVGCRL
eukprot:scaffold31395_cov48-Phaeocystis_antarctica.AAC.2